MNVSLRLLSLVCLLFSQTLYAQDVFQQQRAGWLQKAEQLKPKLTETIKKPLYLVSLVQDQASFQGWKAVKSQPIDTLYQSSLKTKSGVVADFGEHLTGTVTFTLEARRGTPDAPSRVKLTFGEVPAELATPFDPYPGGLSRAWLQDEVFTVVDLPATITIPRRLAFRYVKIDLLGASNYFDLKLSDITCKATTSANTTPPVLAQSTPPLLADIDRVGYTTLKECMQTVYEDGPKRDRRLWIGDLYLESLANMYSFKNFDLTKRCFYLLAGLSNEQGYLPSNVFETPQPHPQKGAPFLFEYSLLYNAALNEYLAATNDRTTALELWPIAKKQLENTTRYVDANGLFDTEAAAKDRWWLFVDWKEGLDKQATIQGLILFSLQQTYDLAKQLGKEKEVASIPAQIKKMTAAVRKTLYDPKTGLAVSGPAKQISYASQIWLILSNVLTKEEGQKALNKLPSVKEAVYPGGPYLYHYLVAAMIHCGMNQEAKNTLLTYWGGMVKKGADTFWEVYDPTNEKLSPYNFYPVNSYCHAWSCTPVYFIRKYPDIFQR
ncbi:alpha-L-rhamnosidase-related protein [Spirosoma pomorum]